MIEEIQSVIQGKMAIPLISRHCLVFTGADRVRYLNGQTTNDISKLAEGKAIHTTVCNAKGKMQGELFVTHTGASLQIDFPSTLAETLPLRLQKYIIADDVEVSEPENPLQGFHMIKGAFELPSQMVRYESQRLGISGYDLWLKSEETPPFPVASPEVTEWIYIKHGIPQWGTDISEENLPPEIFRENQTISYRKGCYIGQETIARIKSIGRVKKKLCLLTGNEPLENVPTDIIENDKLLGKLTSAQKVADESGKFHALAILKNPMNEVGTILTIDDTSWSVTAALCDSKDDDI